MRKKQEEQKEINKQLELERINNMICPVCKSTNKQHIIKSKSNGILGPGHYSTITDNYFICKDCGVHYSDLNKK